MMQRQRSKKLHPGSRSLTPARPRNHVSVDRPRTDAEIAAKRAAMEQAEYDEAYENLATARHFLARVVFGNVVNQKVSTHVRAAQTAAEHALFVMAKEYGKLRAK